VALRLLDHAPTSERRPLIVTGEAELLDDLLRLAAAGGCEVEVAADAVAARSGWPTAPFVLVGADRATACARSGLVGRASVMVVLRGPEAEPPWSEAELLHAEHVAVLPAAEGWLVDRFADHAAGSPTRGRVVAVIGGRGGAGASVLATGLAVTARRRGLDTLLLDADPFGGGVDLVLGWESLAGLRWPELVDARGRVSPPALVSALPGQGGLAVLSFDRSEIAGVPAEAMAAALDAGRRGRDLVVVDLPRRFDEPSLIALTCADRAYLVVPAELRACVSAGRIAHVVRQHCPTVGVVVRGPAPGRLTPQEVAAGLDLPLAGTLRPEPGLAEALERGQAPAGSGHGPLADLCRRLLGEVGVGRRSAVAS
jgi:secretion/DNA translocation related CpaE-like protein